MGNLFLFLGWVLGWRFYFYIWGKFLGRDGRKWRGKLKIEFMCCWDELDRKPKNKLH
jgi:hypothetical protein